MLYWMQENQTATYILRFKLFTYELLISSPSVLFGPVYWWRKPEFNEKSTDLSQVTDKLYHIEITLVLLPINNSQVTVDDK
jgi:hypothetical protein